jgi:hypothetical protein
MEIIMDSEVRDAINEVVGNISTRLRELGNMTMNELRIVGGYGCDTEAEAIASLKHHNRGELLEHIIMEEFYEEL